MITSIVYVKTGGHKSGDIMFLIRKALPEDALGIAIVNVYTWKTTYMGLLPEDLIDARILEIQELADRCRTDIMKKDNFLVAVVDHTIAGFCIWGRSQNEVFTEAGEIIALYVLKGFQGIGLGRSLFSAGVNELIGEGHASMIINCLKGSPSLGFYRHMGGKPIGERQDVIKGITIHEDIVYFENLQKVHSGGGGK
jgi:GNAT superfamily N-acetyltransferase